MDSITVQLISGLIYGLPAIILAVATLIKVIKAERQVADITRDLDGRFSELLAEVERRARLEGVLEGNRQRRHDEPPTPPDSGNPDLPHA